MSNLIRLAAQIPAAIANRLQALGATIAPQETAALYVPLHPCEPYAGVHVIRDVPYGADRRQQLDVFSPAAGDGLHPVLLFVHGGGFVAGNRRGGGSPFYDNLMLWAAENGMTGVNISYRLAPAHRWPSAQQDIAAALSWVRRHIAVHGGDTNRIVLCGHSAGAVHVAQYLAHPLLRHAADGVCAAILLSGIYDLPASTCIAVLQSYFGENTDNWAARSALPGLVASGVPLLLASAELDPPDFLRQAEILHRALPQSPAYLLEGHSHLSEIYAIHSSDNALGDVLIPFIATHAAPHIPAPAKNQPALYL